MKKKNLQNKLTLTIKDLSALSGREASDIKGGIVPSHPPVCNPCLTNSCPIDQGGYSCGNVRCYSEVLSSANC